MQLAKLQLKTNADRRLRQGHLWVYSNEIDTTQTPLSDFESGQAVSVVSEKGKVMGSAWVNPQQLICARLYSREADRLMDRGLMKRRLQQAISLRELAFNAPYYRLVYGDSDGLPGLVVDRFGTTLVVQVSSAGMEQHLELVIELLAKLLKPEILLIKNDGKMRALEGLESYVKTAFGELPENGWVRLQENGCWFDAPLLDGQKTGWFYDHRMNRQRVQNYAAGARVLDVFSYIGGWGIQALSAGAMSLTCIDASEKALAMVAHNAQLNNLSAEPERICGDAFDAMKRLRDERRQFDLIILDPPALIPRRKDIRAGEQAYQRLNELALRLMADNGILVTASCSMHLAKHRQIDLLRAAARKIDRQCQILEQGGQGPDHPVHPAIVETDYLKSVIARISKSGF